MTDVKDPGAPTSPERPSRKARAIGLLKDIAYVAAIYLVFTTFIAKGYQVPTPSMEPTIHGSPNFFVGDKLFVEKLSRHFSDFEVGDIVVFDPPPSERSDTAIVKRIVGCPGDRITVREGHLLIDGRPVPALEKLHLHYVNAGLLASPDVPYEVPEAHYFMMGDNSGGSHDSRFFGPIPEDRIIGKVIFRYWPPARIGVVE